MTRATNFHDMREQLLSDGYCVLEQILSPEMLDRVRVASDDLIAAQPAEHFYKSTGSMISVYDDPFFAELVAYQPALDALDFLGCPDSRWTSGFVISKPGHSPPLFWHQDWWAWNDPVSYTDLPLQLFLMYYLVDPASRTAACASSPAPTAIPFTTPSTPHIPRSLAGLPTRPIPPISRWRRQGGSGARRRPCHRRARLLHGSFPTGRKNAARSSRSGIIPISKSHPLPSNPV